MRLIDGDAVIEHAEVNCESREFIRKLSDYIDCAEERIFKRQIKYYDEDENVWKIGEVIDNE